ncbi:7709_t:CDS:1 [Cetraspora pellucida]|uniref:7709_t:CDS:1 n=1 Tax=Cetraspora pellucida TaxID=1433469 RepID=A0ACA9LGX1_9GLOM|nr:7709_t:CDS:1 [Cetraspora pellucida]
MKNAQHTINSLKELNLKLASEITKLREENAEILELRREKDLLMSRIIELEQSAKENAENTKLRDSELNAKIEQTSKENAELKARVLKLEQKQLQNEEKNNYIAKLDEDTKEINRSLVNITSTKTENSNDTHERIDLRCDESEARGYATNTPASDITNNTFSKLSENEHNNVPNSNVSDNAFSETKSFENKEIEFLERVHKEQIIDEIRERNWEKKLRSQDLSSNNISQSNKNKVEKFMSEVSVSNGNTDSDILPTTLNKTEESKTQCFASQSSNTNFMFLYEKLCDAIILANCKTQEVILCYCNFGEAIIQRRNEIASEKQVDPESNTVSRILNKEVRAQLPANISDALLWKRIEKAKKLYKLFSAIGKDKIHRIHSFSADSISKMTNKEIQYIIDNVPFDYSIKIESTLNSKKP